MFIVKDEKGDEFIVNENYVTSIKKFGEDDCTIYLNEYYYNDGEFDGSEPHYEGSYIFVRNVYKSLVNQLVKGGKK